MAATANPTGPLRCLVTGGSGFVGGAVVRALAQAGHQATVLPRGMDVSSAAIWNGLDHHRARAVLHLAGKVFVPDSFEDPALFFRVNTLGTVEALQYCRRHNLGLVLAGAYVYGAQPPNPIPEEAPTSATNPYTFSKLQAEAAARFFHTTFGVPVTILRIFNVYGPGQPARLLVGNLLAQAQNSAQDLWVEDLRPRRDFVFVEDVARAFVLALEKLGGLQVYNVASGTSHSVAQLAALVQRAAGHGGAVRSRERPRPGDVLDVRADITAIDRGLGWQPRVELLDGITRCVGAPLT